MIFVSFDCDSDLDMYALLRIAGRLRYPATVFLIGKYVEKYPQIVKKVAACRHVVLGNHTHTHPWNEVWGIDRVFARLKASARREEILRAHRAIENLTGRSPRVFRSPHFSPPTLGDLRYLRSLGYTHDSSRVGRATPFQCRSGLVEIPVTATHGGALSNWLFLHWRRASASQFTAVLKRLFDTRRFINMYLDPRFFVTVTDGNVRISPDGEAVLGLLDRRRGDIAGYEEVVPA